MESVMLLLKAIGIGLTVLLPLATPLSTVAPTLVCLLISLILWLWLCLHSSERIMKFFGKSGIEAVSRLMGFLLVCMGVQFVINGILEIIHNEMAA